MNSSRINRVSSVICLFITINVPATIDAFALSSVGTNTARRAIFRANNGQHGIPSFDYLLPSTSITSLKATSGDSGDKKDDDIDRLLSMAAKLRAEAASLEAEKAKERADAAERAFREFDTDKDGAIDINELKTGIERVLKTELSDKRAEELMKEFDASGDGKLQLDEFVTIDQFRNRLEALSREERRLAVEAQKNAKKRRRSSCSGTSSIGHT